eukprot:TRINITY_DN54034_c0_g1_i1.p1 TRINITY_DN54034_c0_g1~~TRINITY_DN54034_c0_g1_i1.p1  ORF type:complete len:339 (+),score=45.78 TRINITY_DN54034_c0_g1_i1:91-1017(+)
MEGPTCPRCHRPERLDHLGGQHMCRVIARYRCPACRKSWTSQRGSFDPREGRVLDQYCSSAACNQRQAEVVSWEHLSEDALAELQDRRSAAQARAPEWMSEQDFPHDGSASYQSNTWQYHNGSNTHTDGVGHHMGTYVVGNAQTVSYSGPHVSHKGKGGVNTYGGNDNGMGSVVNPWDLPSKGKHNEWQGKGGKPPAKGGKSQMKSGGKWQVVAGSVAIEDPDREQTVVPRLITQEHRPDLCEPCRKWGDCSGWFADPFFVFAAATFLVEQDGGDSANVHWENSADGFELNGSRDLGSIRLIIETRSL